MTIIPGTFPRSKVVAAFAALGLTGDEAEDISSLEISGTEVTVGVFARDQNGELISTDGELAQHFYTVMVDESA
jgi:hypothetical protein